MRVVVVYKDASDHGREVREYIRDYQRFAGKQLEIVDPETRDGSAFCQAYDIVEYPTIIALDSVGRVHQLWKGRPLPQISQVSYYDQ